MNKYLDALWDLKLRVDAYNEHDEKANKAFDILKEFILRAENAIEKVSVKVAGTSEAEQAIEIMKKHVEVQDHPDTFFYREYPERVLIDLRYKADAGGWAKKSENMEENNKDYNLVKRVLGLPEYEEVR